MDKDTYNKYVTENITKTYMKSNRNVTMEQRL